MGSTLKGIQRLLPAKPGGVTLLWPVLHRRQDSSGGYLGRGLQCQEMKGSESLRSRSTHVVSEPFRASSRRYLREASSTSSVAGAFWARNSASALFSGIRYVVLLPWIFIPDRK
jgi:hypothetical protein